MHTSGLGQAIRHARRRSPACDISAACLSCREALLPGGEALGYHRLLYTIFTASFWRCWPMRAEKYDYYTSGGNALSPSAGLRRWWERHIATSRHILFIPLTVKANDISFDHRMSYRRLMLRADQDSGIMILIWRACCGRLSTFWVGYKAGTRKKRYRDTELMSPFVLPATTHPLSIFYFHRQGATQEVWHTLYKEGRRRNTHARSN